jgi:hypothetical protein
LSHNERYKSSIVRLYFHVRYPGITQSRYKIPLVRIDPRFVTILPLRWGLLARDSDHELLNTGRNPNNLALKSFVAGGRTRSGQLLL